ncbi:MAG TPA: hypothetical protein VE221_04430 [Sphingomicrobium sp.]|nr:hypothetical protein [Sphingomicrobium sp.]
MRTDRIRDRFTPWAGLALGASGFFLAQQLGAGSIFLNCRVGSPWMVILCTVLGLALIAVGAVASRRVFGAKGEASVRRTIAAVSLMSAALFALATLLPVIAALVIPPCWA